MAASRPTEPTRPEPAMHLLLRLRTAATFLTLTASLAVSHAATYVYVSNADSKDISVLLLDPVAGDLLQVQTVPVGGQVMPLAVSPDRKLLHAAIRSQPFQVMSFR